MSEFFLLQRLVSPDAITCKGDWEVWESGFLCFCPKAITLFLSDLLLNVPIFQVLL